MRSSFGKNEYVPINFAGQANSDYNASLAAARCNASFRFGMDCTIYGAGVLLGHSLYFRDRDHGLHVCLSDLHHKTLAAHSYGPPKVGILSESPFWPAIVCRAVRSDSPRPKVTLTMTEFRKPNTSWVATAYNVPRSLRSVSPASPCHHI